MSEMATAHFGQLAISNQPSFHIPYLFRYSDKPEYVSTLLKAWESKCFRPGWQAFPGDEDNGSLSFKPAEARKRTKTRSLVVTVGDI